MLDVLQNSQLALEVFYSAVLTDLLPGNDFGREMFPIHVIQQLDNNGGRSGAYNFDHLVLVDVDWDLKCGSALCAFADRHINLKNN